MGERPTARFTSELLGEWGEPVSFRVTPEHIRAYAEIVGDTRSSAAAGQHSGPVFPVVAVWDALNQATERVVPASIAELAVHYTHDLRLHAPLPTNGEVWSRAAATAVRVRRAGTEVSYRLETRDPSGALLVEQWATEIYRGVWPEHEIGDQAPRLEPAPTASEPDGVTTIDVPSDVTDRYAQASGDYFAIHLDDGFAQSVGLPGRIVHGMCSLALATTALLEHGGHDVNTVRRVATRFSKPLRPGSTLVVTKWTGAAGAVHFEAQANGNTVLRDGVLRLE
jgi:acyl dehydratase